MCAVDAPVAGVVSLSGLHDLRPIVNTFVNEWLQLDLARAAALSPALLAPAAPTRVIALAGARESEAFHDQARELADAWRAHGCDTSSGASDDDHFTLCSRLVDPNDPLTARIADLALASGTRHGRARTSPEPRSAAADEFNAVGA